MNVHLYNPRGPDRVAMISVREVWGAPGSFTLVVARGPRRGALRVAHQAGPVYADSLSDARAQLVSQLGREGFLLAGLDETLTMLRDQSERVRARGAERAGWARDPRTVDALLAAAAQGTTELTSIVEALGRIGDPRGLPLARAEAERKLLSRRRSGAEALRLLRDAQGLSGVAARALARLPEAVRDAHERGEVPEIEAAFKQVDAKELGLALDTLYDLATPAAIEATRALLRRVVVHQPHFWRYAKSILKRAMLRCDGETFAILVRRIELAARTARGTTAALKSGLDGQTRRVRVFSVITQRYVMRRCWRWMKRLATHEPARYAMVAAEVLAVWEPGDREKPRALGDEWSRAYVLNRVWRGQDPRLSVNMRSLRFQRHYNAARMKIPEGARMESFPECWDAAPDAYLAVLARSKVIELVQFAERAVRARHPEVLARAGHAAVLAMLGSPHQGVVELALGELERRFDPRRPDWSLLDAMIVDERESVRERALHFLVRCSDVWSRDIERAMSFLCARDPRLSATAAGLMVVSLSEADAWFRRELAERLVTTLQSPEPFEGAWDGVGRVARESLAGEISAVLALPEVMALVTAASPAAQALGGVILGGRSDAAAALGSERVLAMAMHDVAAVRAASHAMLRAELDALRNDPARLFALADGEWSDTRAFVFALLRDEVDVGALGVDGVVALCDATHPEVQSFGREMALRHFDRLDPQELIHRLAQHPAPAMRAFAMDLVEGHLKPGFIPLAKLEGFFRRALLDLSPSRAEKQRVMRFLLDRGLRDERQAEVAVKVLGEVCRTRCVEDAERALSSLVRLQVAFPTLESPLILLEAQ